MYTLILIKDSVESLNNVKLIHKNSLSVLYTIIKSHRLYFWFILDSNGVVVEQDRALNIEVKP